MATGADCSVGMGCDLALGSYYISRDQNLNYISSLFGIDDYRTLAPYNTGYSNLDFITADSRINVYFRCRCLALPSAPFSTYLAGSFPYRVSQGGESYASVAAKFHNLTTANLLQPAPSSVNDVLDAGTVVNVTVTCSCANRDLSPDYKLLTYPLGDGETPDSVAASHGLSSQAEVDLFRRYNPRADSIKEGDVVYISLSKVTSVVFEPLYTSILLLCGTGLGRNLFGFDSREEGPIARLQLHQSRVSKGCTYEQLSAHCFIFLYMYISRWLL